MKFFEGFIYVITRTMSVAFIIGLVLLCALSPIKYVPGGIAFLYVFLYLFAGFIYLSMLWAIDSLFTRLKRLEKELEEKNEK